MRLPVVLLACILWKGLGQTLPEAAVCRGDDGTGPCPGTAQPGDKQVLPPRQQIRPIGNRQNKHALDAAWNEKVTRKMDEHYFRKEDRIPDWHISMVPESTNAAADAGWKETGTSHYHFYRS